MILEEIYTSLIKTGYKSIGINRDNISLFQGVFEQNTDIIAIYDCPSGLEYSEIQLTHINKQITEYFYGQGFHFINLLGIICTDHVENVRDIAINNNFWIINTSKSQLIIYENQDSHFARLEKQIQSILRGLSVNDFNISEDSSNSISQRKSKEKAIKSEINQFITPCNTTIIIVSILVYLIVNIISGEDGGDYLQFSGALYWPSIVYEHEYYRLFTYMFLHADTSHLANNMLVLFFLGDNLERAAGKWKYLIMYFGAGIMAGIISMSYNMINNYNIISIGASGAIFGVVGAMVNIVIKNRGRLENLSTRQMILFVVFSLYGGLTSQGVDNLAHIGGLVSGFLLAAIIYKKPTNKNTNVNS